MAKFCTAKWTESAFEAAIRRRISRLITCDHLELIFSDKYHESDKLGTFSKRLIDEMTTTWKVKKVTVTFISGYSTAFDFEETFGIGPQHPLLPFGFNESVERVTRHSKMFEEVKINLLRADRFAEDFVSTLSDYSPVPEFQNLIPVIQKLFPTRKILICMPLHCFQGNFDQFFSNFLRFSWCQDKDFMYRGTEMFVRFCMLKKTIPPSDFVSFKE